MGNSVATEAAAVVIEHPGGKMMQIAYRPLDASQVMTSNPGHYVALITTNSTTYTSSSSTTTTTTPGKRQLQLLRPEDALQVGHVYRLISFEEVLKLREMGSKKPRVRMPPSGEQDRSSADSTTTMLGTNVERRRSRRGCIPVWKRRDGHRSGMFILCGCPGREPCDESDSDSINSAVGEVKQQVEEVHELESLDAQVGPTNHLRKYRQWRPTLQSITEIES